MEKKEIKQIFHEASTREDVAKLLGISDKSLRYFLYKRRPENMYHTFDIPKKNGSKRIISAPNIELKNIQRKLANVLSAVYVPKVCAFGFVDGKNNVGNAALHCRKRLVFNIDLKDYFSQIHFGRVRGMLMKKPYCISEEAATTISQIACFNGSLPQGAPSSPIITNMVTAPLDNALMRLAKKTNCVYSRYADDISFSTFTTAFDASIVSIVGGRVSLGKELERIFQKNSFCVNPEKITLRSRNSRQEVTGLTVNQFPNLRRSYTKQLRAILHNCEKFGVYNSAKKYIELGLCKNKRICELLDKPDSECKIVAWFKQVLVGKVQYIKQVKGINSYTYYSFAQKINDVFGEPVFDLTAFHTFENTIRNSVFILECDEGDSFIQGSSFYLSGVGLLTNYHVTEGGEFFKVFSYDTYNEKHLGVIGKNLNEIASDCIIDYALYTFPNHANVDLSFKCGNSRSIKVGDRVTVIGYPNHEKGSSPNIQSCTITSRKSFFGAPFYTVSGRIIHGASGGIVLNSENEAIGIIKGGIVNLSKDDSNENQGFVPIHLVMDHLADNNLANR